MKSLTKKHQKSDENAKICYIGSKNLQDNMLRIKNIVKLATITIIQKNIVILHIAYVI